MTPRPQPGNNGSPAPATGDRRTEGERRRLVARGGAVNILGNAFGIIEWPFLIVVTRVLGAAVLGNFLVARYIVDILLRLGVLGLDKGLLRHIPIARASRSSQDRKHAVLGTSFRYMLGTSLILVAAAFLLTDVVLELSGKDHTGDAQQWVSLMVFALPGQAAVVFFLHALRGMSKMAAFVLVQNLTFPALTFVLSLAGIGMQFGWASLVFAYLSSTYACAALSYVLYRKAFPSTGVRALISSARDGALLRFSVPQGVTELLNYSLPRVGAIILLGFYADRAEFVATFAVATWIAVLVRKPRQGLEVSAAPVLSGLLARGEHAQFSTTYRQVARWISLLYVPVACVLALASPLIMSGFGPEYRSYWMVVPILVVGRLVNGLGGPTQIALLMAGRSRLELLNNALANLTNIVLNLVLVPRYGVLGAALATSTCMLVYDALRVVELRVLLHTSANPRDLLRLALCALAPLGLACLLLRVLPGGLWVHALTAAAFLLGYAYSVRLLGLVPSLSAILPSRVPWVTRR